MPRHILYGYVDGADIGSVADVLDARFADFVGSRSWIAGRASVVNQKHEDWDLGLNLELPDTGAEPAGWFADVEAIALFLGRLHSEFGLDFIIGIGDAKTGITDDLFDVSTDFPDLAKLRAIIGVGDIA